MVSTEIGALMAGPSVATVKRLFAVSGNRCAFPGCEERLADVASESVVGEVCHIKAKSSDGPRYDAEQTDEERHGFGNLVLLCPTHHARVDGDPGRYTVEKLLEIKARHEARYAGGAEPSDDVARQFLPQFGELLERLKRLLAEDPTLAARLAAITGDGNVVGDHNVATVNKLSAGDYAIQIGQLNLTLSPDQLRALPVSADTASPLPPLPVSADTASPLPPLPVSAPTASPLSTAFTELSRQLRVFLCDASGDKPAVRDLYRRLCSDGIAPWLDEEDVAPGQSWQLAIEDAVRSSDVAIICLSSRPITEAGYVQKGIMYVLDVADEQPGGAIFLIPLRLEECEVPERLRKWQWVDLFREAGYERLLRALRERAESLGLGRPAWEPEMVLIPAGEFLMGSDPKKHKDACDDEFPQHTLYLPDYYIAKTAVTNAQYAVFVQATDYDLLAFSTRGKPTEGEEDHPVVDVSRHDAVAYCNWLSQMTGKAYRLPSEAEWEKAARGTDARTYPWGDEPPDKGRCNFDNNVGTTTAVGRYSPQGDSPYGCTDMAGNVWEWTRSLYKDYPYGPGDGRENLEDREYALSVLRGGAFNIEGRFVRCAFRDRYSPDVRFRYYGFRVVAAPVGL